jgi:hypothetical protein
MASHHHHKIFFGLSSVVVLIFGLMLGVYLAANLKAIDMEAIKIGLLLVIIILVLMTGGIVLEIKDMVQLQQKTKTRAK